MQPEAFDIIYKGATVKVEQHSLSGQWIYRVKFNDHTAPLVLHRATDYTQSKFWTSIPEGRQELAEKIGALIEQYQRQKK